MESLNKFLEMKKEIAYTKQTEKGIGKEIKNLCDGFKISVETQKEVFSSKHKNDVLCLMLSNLKVTPENIKGFETQIEVENEEMQE